MADKIKIAEQRIEEAEANAKHFAKMFAKTGDVMYQEMREFEIEKMNKIVEAIMKAKKRVRDLDKPAN